MASFHLPLRSYEMLWLFMCCLSTTSTGQHCFNVSTEGKLIYAHLLIRKQRAPAPGSLACSRRLDRGDNANRCIFLTLLIPTALHCLRVSMGWWLLRLSAKIFALLLLSVNFFQLRLTKKLKINFFCFKKVKY